MSEAGNSGPDSLATGKAAAYRVLARKYRPSNFSELVGQEPMVRTLTNAFATGRIAQAWMLTGVRGVGKTTTARILARALNYKTATVDQPSVDLAVLGEHCQAIMEGRHVDVIEMDAASHTGIDDIRDIIERVRYAPVSARYKVYIIDEVHMLSTQAFNGLLKTLEEPPPHVKFIFATTEIRKVPITVLSRCQRFDLRRIDAGALVAHLSSIAGKEGISVDDDALAMIARAAEGSARDSLSILDQAIAHGAGSVSAEAVRAMLGLADRARIVDLFEYVMKGDVAAALGEFRAQYDTGADPAAVLTDLAEFNHLVTRLRFVPTAMDDASLSQDERQRGADFARALSVRVLSRTWQMLLKGIPEVQSSNRPVSAAEMVLIRLAHAADLPTLDEALRSLESGASATGAAPRPNGAPVNPGNGGAGGNGASAVAQARIPGGSGGAQTMRLVEATPAPAAFVAPPQPAPETQAVPLKSLADIVALADAQRDIAFKVLVKRCIRLVHIEPGRIDVSLTDDAPKMLLNELTTKLRAWTGRSWLVALSKEDGGQTLAEMESTKRENAFLDARNDPTVAAILARFPGAKIIDVRIPDTPDADATDAEMPVEPPADDDEP
ncbi:DNA polymerase III subunit gamma/tau [Mesorhizobium sp. B2-5-13]|uniref:DNA polymerase III subunit gamma/tau n=1 Tax=unclassified Mesorhizobium TaxID=325217 RepID=UPI0011296BE2|nr:MULTISPECIES: DNA polymerase III subunit gamma/tau [unclassified Mesorhizobium]TPJ44740.1 DNA polymerase III subunit gamma/tau [Mesorhizobium sp. B2-6-5]TPJ91890.1 DNA polymerase III subunit gamma/tau [Mesorhizobium sp. B2-5-13]TPK53218.1 DNA polymerase III subunit gamma/tau [Mesorhizobium sp. B2-5-5]